MDHKNQPIPYSYTTTKTWMGPALLSYVLPRANRSGLFLPHLLFLVKKLLTQNILFG